MTMSPEQAANVPEDHAESSAEVHPVEALAEEFLRRHRRGECPSLAEYLERYPDLAEQIRAVFPALIAVEQLKPLSADAGAGGACDPPGRRQRIGAYRLLRVLGRGGMGVVYEAEHESLGRRVALKMLPMDAAQDTKLLARFRRESRAAAQLHHGNIVPVFEVGQDGDVFFYAMQYIPGQSVDAVINELRRLRANSGGTSGQDIAAASEVARSGDATLDAEACESPSNVGSGPAAPCPGALSGSSELSMVECDYRRYCRNVARLGLQAAEALAYAHGRGIIHRDIKPANLLLDTTGVLWVSDFGLVKTQDPALTDTGDLVGTVRYMAPERFRGECDARADVYALGLTLYELLVLRPAFDGQDRLHLVEQIGRQEPARLRKLDPRIPRDLETITMKAIEKAPDRRYASAEALSGDLRRFLADEPIEARRTGPLERLGRWTRRNPLAAGLCATVVLVAALGFAGVFGQMQVARANEKEAREHATRADEKEWEANKERDEVKAVNVKLEAALKELRETQEQLRGTLYASRMNLAQYAWEAGDVERVRALLELQLPKMGETDLRNFEWHYFNRLCHSELFTLKHNGLPSCVAYSPDGKRLATVSKSIRGEELKVWDAQTGEELRSFKAEGLLYSVAFSPDGKRLATPRSGTGGNWEVKEWDADTGKEQNTFQTDTKGTLGLFNCVAYSPDGKRLAAGGGFRSEVKVWDTKSRMELFTLKGHTSVHSVTYTSDGKRLATASEDKTVKVWDAENGKELFTLQEQRTAELQSVAFSPDGKQLATIDKTVKVWDAETGKELRAIQDNTAVVNLAYSPDGKRLAGALADHSVRLWDAMTGEPLFTLRGHSRTIASVAFRPDGKHLASAALDETVKVWDAQTGHQEPLNLKVGVPRGRDFSFTGAVVSPDGKRVASAGGKSVSRVGPADWVTKVWDIQTGKELMTLKENLSSPALSPDGKRLATSSVVSGPDRLSKVKVWDLETGKELFSLEGSQRSPSPFTSVYSPVAYSPDGKRLAGAGLFREPGKQEDKHKVKVWDAQTGKELLVFEGGWDRVIFSPDGKRLAAPSREEIKLWDTQTGQVIQSFKGGNGWLAFSPDGKRLAASSREETKLWDTQTGEVLRSFKGRDTTSAFSPDGKRLAITSFSLRSANEVTVWDVETGKELLTLKGYAERMGTAAFSPDGKRLVSASSKGVKVWDAQSGQELLNLPAGFILSFAFTPDGRRLVIGTGDTVKIYDATPLPEKP
jgi:WD40 repeat protein/serine/threonine protein kinase